MDFMFGSKKQDSFVSDFGFKPPHRTVAKCSNPCFSDKILHRIAIMKKEHFGSENNRDEGGLPGWSSKFQCTGCGKTFKIDSESGYFHPETSISTKNERT